MNLGIPLNIFARLFWQFKNMLLLLQSQPRNEKSVGALYAVLSADGVTFDEQGKRGYGLRVYMELI
jgi:hypothetical protein